MELINPWHLYFILQLDSIKDLLGGPAVGIPLGLSLLVFMLVKLFTPMILNDTYESHRERVGKYIDSLTGAFKKIAIVCACLLGVNAFIPSSERMAVIVVLPAVANNAAIQTEAKELYDLAKRGLARLTEAPATEQPEARQQSN